MGIRIYHWRHLLAATARMFGVQETIVMKYIVLLLCNLLPSLLFADNVTVGQAESLAVNFFKTGAQTRSASPQVRLVWNSEGTATRSTESPAYYVFNRTDENGFIIVSGDDIAMPVLGYSFKSGFTADNMPVNLKGWLAEFRRQINDARSRSLTASAKTIQSWKDISSNMGTVELQRETAQWDQNAPYNYYCPIVNSKRAVTGCVATALAIVMRYHEWPDRGIGTLPSYSYQVEGYTRTQQGHNLGASYDWKQMPIEYSNSSQRTQAIAKLIYDCGVMSQATYSSVSTGAITQDAVERLSIYMKYSKDLRYASRDWYADTKWISMLRQEIRTNGPVLYNGRNDKNEGHLFVLDGYTSKNYFGVNWGWGGQMNGYFLISALDPEETGTGGGSGGGFLYYQSAVFGLKKSEGETGKPYLMLGPGTDSQTGTKYNGLSANTTEFQTGVPFYVLAAYCWNLGFNSFNGELVVSLMDEEGNLKENIATPVDFTDLPPNKGRGRTFGCIIRGAISEGDRIWLRYRSVDTQDWERMPSMEGAVDEIIVRQGDGKSLSETTSFTYNKISKVILLKTKDGVSYQVISTSGTEVASGAVNANKEIQINTGVLAAGTYKLILKKGESRKELAFVIGK